MGEGRVILAYKHTSVLLNEAVDYWFTDPDGVYVDATLGGAGHSALLLSRLSPRGKLFGLDQDPAAIRRGGECLAQETRVTLLRTNFAALEDKLREAGALPVNGILFDLGVSSPQLDEGERGFSYMRDAQLDMRMDPGRELTARDIVNSWSADEICRVIRRFGEEKWAKRIAEFIAQARETHPLTTTGELVDVIKAAIPASARREGPHPAKRTFQALRIAVNDELGVLERALDQALRCLVPGGHLVVITFHSLEDRLVKEKMRSWLGKCTCPPDLPVCVCGAAASARLLNRKPVLPSATEIENNPRSRSAKLRAAEKISESLNDTNS